MNEKDNSKRRSSSTNFHPLEPEIMKYQSTLCLQLIGHVTHGKSKLGMKISGTSLIRINYGHSLRQANYRASYFPFKIFKCDNEKCETPGCYSYKPSTSSEFLCPIMGCNGTRKLLRHICLVDELFSSRICQCILSGRYCLDGVIGVVACDEKKFPQKQFEENVEAVSIRENVRNLIIAQTKIDLVRNERDKIMKNSRDIKNYLNQGRFAGSPIIPISTPFNLNLDALCETIVKEIPIPERNPRFSTTDKEHELTKMAIVRSFDANKPGEQICDFKGGVIGGMLVCGSFSLGDMIVIFPGIISKESGSLLFKPLLTKIVKILCGKNELEKCYPGAIVSLETLLDPALTRSDRMAGQVVYKSLFGEKFVEEINPKRYNCEILTKTIRVSFIKFNHVGKSLDKNEKICRIGDVVMLTISSSMVGAVIENLECMSGSLVVLKAKLISVVCVEKGVKVTISKRISKHWRIVGWGRVLL